MINWPWSVSYLELLLSVVSKSFLKSSLHFFFLVVHSFYSLLICHFCHIVHLFLEIETIATRRRHTVYSNDNVLRENNFFVVVAFLPSIIIILKLAFSKGYCSCLGFSDLWSVFFFLLSTSRCPPSIQ